MKSSIWMSCTILYLFFNQVQISSSEPISLMILSAISGILTIYSFIEEKVKDQLAKPVEQQKQINFLNGIELTHLARQQIGLSEEIKTMVGEIRIKPSLDNLVLKVSKQIEKLDHLYKEVSLYKKAKIMGTAFTAFDKEKLIKTATDNIGIGSNSIYKLIDELYLDVIGRREGNNMVKLTYDLMQQNIFTTCSNQDELQSFQQGLQNLLTKVSIAYLKGYLTIHFSEEFLNEYNLASNVTNSVTLSGTIKKLEQLMNHTLIDFKSSIEIAPRDVWRCDPSLHVENVTFVTMNRVFRKQIVPKFYLDGNAYFCNSSCDINNARYPAWSSTLEEKIKDEDSMPLYPIRRSYAVYNRELNLRPFGEHERLYDCKDIEPNEDYSYTIYHTQFEERRQFVRLELRTGHQTKIFGAKNLPSSMSSQLQQWRKPEKLYPECNLCSCNAIDHSDTPYIFTGQILADENHVVTGVRIKKFDNVRLASITKKQIFYPEIQQGRLLANGEIDKNSLKWKVLNESVDEFWNNTLWFRYEFRNFETHDINLPPNRVITGIRFVASNSVRLAVTGHHFDYATGRIKYEYSFSEYSLPQPNTGEINVEDAEIPDPREKSTHLATNTTIRMGTSSFLNDLGQTTIPYFDTQEVITSVPSPMSGAGMYYKYRKGYGGYIGLKLKTYNVLEHINRVPRDPAETAELIYDKLSEGDVF